MSHRLVGTALAASLMVAAVASAAPASAQHQSKLRSCHLSASEQRHLGASYVTSLHVSHTGCSTGKKVTKAFNKCRHQAGGPAGHCNHAVRHFHCSERRHDKLPGVQYDSNVTCTHGVKVVKNTYTQNL
jgi:hypothetical protein